MTEYAVRTDGLTKQYGDAVGLDSVDLNVATNEIYGYLGPNGAGKSTTINVLSGYIYPTDGTARVLGYDPLKEAAQLHQRIGIVPDEFSVYDGLSARRHLSLVIDTKGSDEKPVELLNRVGLGNVAGETATEFSEGMKKRLALAMALVDSPDLLLLDEPFTGLDPHGVKLVRERIRTESNNGATVFVSSHILGQIEAICDRVGVLHHGTLVAEDSPSELRSEAGLSEEASLEDIVLALTDADITMEGEH